MNFAWIQTYNNFICIRLINFLLLNEDLFNRTSFLCRYIFNYFDGDNFPIASILDT